MLSISMHRGTVPLCTLGNAPANKLFDLVKVQKKCDGAPRKFDDYEVVIDKANLPSGVTIEEMI